MSASTFNEGQEGYAVRVTRSGAFVASRADPDVYGEAAGAIGRDPAMLSPLWTTLLDLALALGAPPGSPATLGVWLTKKDNADVVIRRAIVLAEPTADDLASIAREARRATGDPVWEPDEVDTPRPDSPNA